MVSMDVGVHAGTETEVGSVMGDNSGLGVVQTGTEPGT